MPFVTLYQGGWDHHTEIFKTCGTRLPTFEATIAALIEDLDQRGMLASTLVVALGEFGRTPKVNDRAGRDHWASAMSVLFAGGGTPGGSGISTSLEPPTMKKGPTMPKGPEAVEASCVWLLRAARNHKPRSSGTFMSTVCVGPGGVGSPPPGAGEPPLTENFRSPPKNRHGFAGSAGFGFLMT